MVTKSKCAFGPCLRTSEVKGLCNSHYQQQYAGKELAPLRETKWLHRDETGRVCTMCMTYKTWDNFYTRKKSRCKRCTIKINTEVNQRRKSA